jgi:hypothetical protein
LAKTQVQAFAQELSARTLGATATDSIVLAREDVLELIDELETASSFELNGSSRRTRDPLHRSDMPVVGGHLPCPARSNDLGAERRPCDCEPLHRQSDVGRLSSERAELGFTIEVIEGEYPCWYAISKTSIESRHQLRDGIRGKRNVDERPVAGELRHTRRAPTEPGDLRGGTRTVGALTPPARLQPPRDSRPWHADLRGHRRVPSRRRPPRSTRPA